MSTKITLDDPTGSDQWIADLGVWVKNGESIQVESPVMAKGLLQNPIWNGRMPHDDVIERWQNGEHEEATSEGGKPGDATEAPQAGEGE